MMESARKGERRPLTIGVMARAPLPGLCKTRLVPVLGREGAAHLYQAMLLDTLEGVERLGPERMVVLAAPEDDGVSVLRGLISPSWELHPQRGPDLGARLQSAFRDLHCDGALVCLIDSDSPVVRWASLGRALRAPRSARAAIAGPCEDGGYYLIGMTSLELGILDAIPWSTSAVMSATRSRCQALSIALDELPMSWDVDEAADVERLVQELGAEPDLAPRTHRLLKEMRT
jgi:rSAM/selenodomain-associated transferase 1